MTTSLNTEKTIIIVGANSVHTTRFIKGVLHFYTNVVFITNNTEGLALGSTVLVHKLKFKLTSLKTRYQIAKIIKQHTNPIIHIHQANSYAFHTLKAVQLAAVACTTILTTWGSDILVLPHKNIIYKRIVQFNLSNSNIITSDSLYMSSQIMRLAHKIKQLYTINFGIEKFPAASCDLGQKQDIILSNRLHKPLYNVDKIIRAFAKLRNNPKYDKYKLVIAAIGPETENLKHLANRLNLSDWVKFVGMVSYQQLQHLYQVSKIIISIPDSDATSMSLLESMAFGCYPILSNIPANLEWIIDGINGAICQNNTQLHYNIEQALMEISDMEKYEQINQLNYNIIKQKAVFRNNIKNFMKLYKSASL